MSKSDAVDMEERLLAVINDIQVFERECNLRPRFNFFDAVQMTRQEIRHSRFLAFLLDPQEVHGLGDKFLRAVLMASVKKHSCPPVSRLDLSIQDISDALVYCERDHFDISVHIPSLKLLFVIENKIDASEGVGQLSRYRELATRRYPGYKFMGCFLTPEGYHGEDEQWSAIGYDVIAAELQFLMEDFSISDDVGMAIRQYISLIERKIVVSESLKNACRQIYKKHKVALDFIFENCQFSELDQAFSEVVEERLGVLVVKRRGSNYLHFYDSRWLAEFAEFLVADESVWGHRFPVHYKLQLVPKKLLLRLVVGPFEENVLYDREKFIRSLWAELKMKDRIIGASGRTSIDVLSFAVREDCGIDDLKIAINRLFDSMFERVNGALKRGIQVAD